MRNLPHRQRRGGDIVARTIALPGSSARASVYGVPRKVPDTRPSAGAVHAMSALAPQPEASATKCRIPNFAPVFY